MSESIHRGRTHDIDGRGYLLRRDRWDESFADDLAPRLGIPGGLSEEHWRVVRTIRDWVQDSGHCPTVIETCRQTHLSLRRMGDLFPTGYLRGACRLAGLTQLDTYRGALPGPAPAGTRPPRDVLDDVADADEVVLEKVYPTDVLGYLVDPLDWDEVWAALRAQEMGIAGGLTRRHWTILRWVRQRQRETGAVPTVYQACEALDLDLDELERLFPHGYGRGIVKLAGLTIRTG